MSNKLKRPHLTPEIKAETIAMRWMGYTVRTIAERLNVPYETVKSLLAREGVIKGKALNDDVQAVEERLRASFGQVMSDKLSAALDETMIINTVIREKALEALSCLEFGDIDSASKSARALAAISTSVKAGADFARVLASEQSSGMVSMPLPLIIGTLTDEDVEELNRKHEKAESEKLSLFTQASKDEG